jgi:hypothetical protein
MATRDGRREDPLVRIWQRAEGFRSEAVEAVIRLHEEIRLTQNPYARKRTAAFGRWRVRWR